MSESGEEGAATANNIASDEFIKLIGIRTLVHLINPGSENAAVPCCRSSRLFKCRWRTAPPTSFGNLSGLSGCHSKRRGANMDHLSLRSRGDSA
jgi:hypothetical protein